MNAVALYSAFLCGLLTQIALIRWSDPGAYAVYIVIFALIGLTQFTLQSTSAELFLRNQKIDAEPAEANRKILSNEVKIVTVSIIIVNLLIHIQIFDFIEGSITISILASLAILSNIGIGKEKSKYIVGSKINDLNSTEFKVAFFKLALSLLVYFYSSVEFLLVIAAVSIMFQNILFRLYSPSLEQNEQKDLAEKKKSAKQSKVKYPIIRSLLTQGLPEAEILLLAKIAPPGEVVVYRLAKTLSHFITVVLSPLWRSLQPKFYHEQNKDAFLKIIGNGLVITIILTIFALAANSIIGNDVIKLVYGQSFDGAYVSLYLLFVVKSIFMSTNSWFRIWSATTNRQIASLIPPIVSLLVLVLLIFLFKPTSALQFSQLILVAYSIYAFIAYVLLLRSPL